MPPGYPGYSYTCPIPGLAATSPLTPWVAVDGSLAYGLWIEALALAVFWLWRGLARRTWTRGGAISLALVVIAALGASVADDWTAWRDKADCALISQVFPRFSRARWLKIGPQLDHASDQATIVFLIVAAAFLIGTFVTARMAVITYQRRAAR